MDKTELLISSISDASLIRYYIMPNGIMGLMIIYQSNVINLAANDRYFPVLEKTAVRCYTADNSTAADSFTREILAKRSLSGSYTWAERLSDCEVSDTRLGMTYKSLVMTQKAFIEHYIGMILKRLGIQMRLPSVITGYRTHFTLSFHDGITQRQIPFTFKEESGKYTYLFGNIASPGDSLALSLSTSFGKADITADLESSRYVGIRERFDLLSSENALYMFDEDEPIYDNKQKLTSSSADLSDVSDVLLFTGTSCEITLPWCRTVICRSEDTTGYAFIFHDPEHDNTVIHEYSQVYLSDRSDIVTDSTNAIHELYNKDGSMICSHFLPTDTFSAGRYKNYCGKYFCRRRR